MKVGLFVYCHTWEMDRDTSLPRPEANLIYMAKELQPDEFRVLVGMAEAEVNLFDKVNVVEQQIKGVERAIKNKQAEYAKELGELEQRKRDYLSIAWNGAEFAKGS